MADLEQFDVVVIGGGPGGYVAAIRAAQLGLKAACIESRGALGGTCLNVGCIPSKALLESSEVYAKVRHHAQDYGVKVSEVIADVTAMIDRKSKIVAKFTRGVEGLLKKNKVAYLKGLGSFVDPHTIKIVGPDGEKTVGAKSVIIATGSEPIEIPIAKFDGKVIVSSTEALEFSKPPEHLIVIGGGVIGLEMGSVWKRLGSKVTVVEALPAILANMDGAVSKAMTKILTDQGLELMAGTKVTGVKVAGGMAEVSAEGKSGAVQLKGDKVLVAVGRRAFTKGLGLENSGVKIDQRGKIVVNKHLQTDAPHIYAIGDVIDGPMLAHKAEEEGVAVAEMLAGKPGHVNYDAIPNVIYTWPEVASVGLSEEQCKERGIAVSVGQFPFIANARAMCSGTSDGFVKIIADQRTDKILGAHLVGPNVSELVAELAVAIEFGASSEDIARSVHAHPTLAEVVKEAAMAVADALFIFDWRESMSSQSGASDRFDFASGSNVNFLESLYQQYVQDPNSVDSTWKNFFDGYQFASAGVSVGADGAAGTPGRDGDKEAKVEALINAYRKLGHLSAHLNPMEPKPALQPDVLPENHGLQDVKPEQVFHPVNLALGAQATFSDIHQFLVDTYCGHIGADYRDLNNIEAVVWLQEQMERCRNQPEVSKEVKIRVLDKLVQTEGFERFLQDRFLGQKRFSIEGLDSMIPLLDILADDAKSSGVEELNLGMAHRGRLNVLANFMGKDYEQILKEFEGTEFNPAMIEGDVKYHKGFANEIETFGHGKLRVYLSPNPSHLEAVNPVLEGFTRARQRLIANGDAQKVLPILIHGDAAMIGQGLVAETLNFAQLSAYTTGGTIHIVANNLIGFTANQDETKSCDYASDIAKLIRAPVLHVNADDPLAVIWCAKLAVAYRQKYARDFVIDLVGYRRYGHNETDEPGFTQPLLYKKIKDHATVLNIYGNELVASQVITKDELDAKIKNVRERLQQGLEQMRAGTYKQLLRVPEALQMSARYVEATAEEVLQPTVTGVKEESLRDLAGKITSFPAGFTPHPKIVKLFEGRQKMLDGAGSIDWGMAEMLAYASIANEGRHVRLSGQDCRRGTFSHRHAVLRDYNSDEVLEVLNLIGKHQGRVSIINSPLSEQGCLGFEFGYSVADPDALVLWEAQFGDFVNGAQIIIDQFLVASEAKWKQTSGLVLLLPHGYEGQGPEHSSARPERFLQSCGSQNIQVANCTTPAQFFHILRRQISRKFRKPLIICTPKSLLRHPRVVSPVKDFTSGSFVEVLGETKVKDVNAVERVIVCTGKIYYELLEAREKQEAISGNIPLIRMEQLYPFAKQQLRDELAKYPSFKELVWIQEEPINMGAWYYIRPRLEEIVDYQKPVKYIGRRGSGSTAEGSLKSHQQEQARIVRDGLDLSTITAGKAAAVSE